MQVQKKDTPAGRSDLVIIIDFSDPETEVVIQQGISNSNSLSAVESDPYLRIVLVWQENEITLNFSSLQTRCQR